MLKALELSGFKSFADKTRFEFPPGITVVVGPNGSGKSNVVDAMKWVLGEQSAKSLRGKDMADVIFKGSGTSGRKAANSAEVTIIFENEDNRLSVDAPEVHVTRRVFRSGEGEYLINREPCRLKDIKDLFRGTGVGTDAYSLIEQGKVDRMLQASAKDRRAIFEEAAGISRFKAKKIEAQRRLARVEQNLLRLSDIVDEVENRFRSVRNQAGKAKRYREYSDRLKELRTQVGLTDWNRLTNELDETTKKLNELRTQRDATVTELTSLEETAREIEAQVSAAHEIVRETETKASKNRELIASLEASIRHERTAGHESAKQLNRHRNTLSAMTTRAGDLQERVRVTRQSLVAAEKEHAEVTSRLEAAEKLFATQTTRLNELRAAIKSRRTEHVKHLQDTTRYSNDVSGLQAQINSHVVAQEAAEAQLRELEGHASAAREELQNSTENEATLLKQHAAKTEAIEEANQQLEETRRIATRRQEELAVQQSRLSGLTERATLLEELERRHEGVGEGVTKLLEQARAANDGPLQDIRGIVADVIQVDLENAPLVDAALGNTSQYVIVQPGRLLSSLKSGAFKAHGRVGFMPLTSSTVDQSLSPNLSGLPGVVGRVDQIVEAAADFTPVIERLLASTWAVESLAVAFELAQEHPELRFVTMAGEVLERDGSVVVGPRRTSTGLVSRRSELRALRRERAVLEQRVSDAKQEVERLRRNIDDQALACKKLADDEQQVSQLLSDQRVTSRTLQDRLEQLESREQKLHSDVDAAKKDHESATTRLTDTRERLTTAQTALAELETFLTNHEQQLSTTDSERQKQNQVVTAARIDMAKSEQMVDGLRARLQQFQEDQRERDRTLQSVHSQLDDALQRCQQSERSILRATSELATLFLTKESFARDIVSHGVRSQTLLQERGAVTTEVEGSRRQLRSLGEKQHQFELTAGQVENKRDALAERMRDDYGIELAKQAETATESSEEREAIEQEIDDLRRKLNGIGAVNMEALNELEALEERFNTLSSQYQDLSDAKDALERIIHRINADSRRLFTETLEIIRQNFQKLYRRAFGGGHADIMLEEGVDVLEAGVEIVATPPGKPSFNNSLLSGGEKALTAVALLLAIFEFRPSPFCVLDEVDAPFDEANVGRFVDVLHEFLKWTKFVVVTHSKKTMTAATTLYGVTMQESGVSKQVSVTFEDVSEDGHISDDALSRADNDDDRGAA